MKNKGLIFDIRRFSTHDGAGIRTTVFLKGCPLRCIWCQNPEGISPQRRLAYFPSTCILCGSCAEKKGAVQLMNGKILLDRKKNTAPEFYEKICPSGALRADSRVYDIDELTEYLARDKIFFKYGGGVTLSGGEPFFQAKFVIELLQNLKSMNLHTAVESSLFVKTALLQEALPFIDMLFADFKVYDDEAHKKVTNVSNALIKKNIQMVLQSQFRDRVIIRTPLIPDYTATKENLGSIAKDISGWYPRVRYELLNYNPLAKAKYEHVDYAYCFEDNPPLYTAEQMKNFYAIVKANWTIK